MTDQARVLFVAGESGTGKTTACRNFIAFGPLLLADIKKLLEAAPRYGVEIKVPR